MATRKKAKKKSTRSKKSGSKKTAAKRPVPKRKARKKVSAKAAPKKGAAKKPVKAQTATKKKSPDRAQARVADYPRESSGLQSGDFQGLSNVESADSESVNELLEEGNAFEAGIVSGVEDSGRREGKEVRTRQVPEDDVPGEYLDKD